MAFRRCDRLLLFERLRRRSGRQRIGHIEDRSHPAGRSGQTFGMEICFRRQSGLTKVNVFVDYAGQDVSPVKVNRFLWRNSRLRIAPFQDLLNAVVINEQRAQELAALINEYSVFK